MMKRRKGVIAVLLAMAVMLSALSACNKIDDNNNSSAEESTPSEVSPTDTETTEESNISITDNTPQVTETVLPTQTTVPEEDPDPIDSDNQIVQTAESLLGIPFAENGATPADGFDNSGFIYYVLRENGFINCPRLTPEQAAMGTNIGYDELKSGDLAFFCTADSGNPDFGGIYIGEGQMIYSPMPGQTVKLVDISTDYWRGTFVTGVSLS